MIKSHTKWVKVHQVILPPLLMLSCSMPIADEIPQTDTDADGLPDAWELQYGLNPQNPTDATSDQDRDGIDALTEFTNGTVPSGSLDIDGNGQKDAFTDGLLIARALFGFTDNSLVNGAVATDAQFKTPEQIQSRIHGLGDLLDIDSNGEIDALTDGLMVLRYLFGISSESLIIDAVATDATRSDLNGIVLHLDGMMPIDTDSDGVHDPFDTFPNNPTEIADLDEDGIGNNADTDDDSDGIADSIDPQQQVLLPLNRLQADTFNYFWETTDHQTGLAPDRYPTSWSPASIAAIGFALTAYPVGVERDFISRRQAVERTLNSLNFLWQLPMGADSQGTAGYQGFFYHFLRSEPLAG